MIAILKSHRIQNDTLGLRFCILLEVDLLCPLTVKTTLFVHCYEQQAAFRLHDIISGQNSGQDKTELSF